MTLPIPFVKICGLQSLAEAKVALACGATALGFLVGLTHRAEDEVGADEARDIIRQLPEGVNSVLVTHLIDPAHIAGLASFVGARTIQVHGDVPPDGVRRLAALSSEHSLIKAVHVGGPEALSYALGYAELCDALLLDTRTVDRLGGTGRTHDWSLSRRIRDTIFPVPVYLAGGLTPANVGHAAREVAPAGLDVNSGVEDGAGRKDPVRVQLFVEHALKALAAGPAEHEGPR